jgi:hypothetical protein
VTKNAGDYNNHRNGVYPASFRHNCENLESALPPSAFLCSSSRQSLALVGSVGGKINAGCAINDAGQITGYSQDPNGNLLAFILFIFTNPADRILAINEADARGSGRDAGGTQDRLHESRSLGRISIWGYVYYRPVQNLVEIGDTFSLVAGSEKFMYRLENENEGIGND